MDGFIALYGGDHQSVANQKEKYDAMSLFLLSKRVLAARTNTASVYRRHQVRVFGGSARPPTAGYGPPRENRTFVNMPDENLMLEGWWNL